MCFTLSKMNSVNLQIIWSIVFTESVCCSACNMYVGQWSVTLHKALTVIVNVLMLPSKCMTQQVCLHV